MVENPLPWGPAGQPVREPPAPFFSGAGAAVGREKIFSGQAGGRKFTTSWPINQRGQSDRGRDEMERWDGAVVVQVLILRPVG